MFIYHCRIVVRIEMELEIDSADMEIHEVEVEAVPWKGWFWCNFQTSFLFIEITAEAK